MRTEHLRLAIHEQERVGLVSMSHERENRFHPRLLEEMAELLDELEEDDRVRAVVLTGADRKYFSTGLDLAWVAAHVDDDTAMRGYLRLVNRILRRWTLYPKPTVAALNGHTFAAGFFLAAHLDFRFMRADRGWVCLPAIDLDLPVPPGMIAITRAVLPPAGFRHVLLTGRRYTGPEAVALGFVQECFPAGELLPRAVAFAADLAKKRTRTYAEMKRRLRADVVRVMDEEDPRHFDETLDLVRRATRAGGEDTARTDR